MCRLIESIRWEGHHWYNLKTHQARADRSRKELFGCADSLDLSAFLPEKPGDGTGTFKGRIEFGRSIYRIDILPYRKKEVRSLRLLHADHLHYEHKYADRSQINELFANRGKADDVLFVRDGLLCDTSYCNIALFDGNTWYTPSKPLLKGTMLSKLLEEGLLAESDIRPADLRHFRYLSPINSMIDLDRLRIGIQRIWW